MKSKLGRASRLLIFAAGAALIFVLFTPIWRIELDAPQYPEGLSLRIYANGLKGNVDIINGLNHYIGMKTLHTDDFFEFTILPFCIMFFVIACMLVAILNRRKWLNLLFALFLGFGVIAMVDFWRWEYNYGHNLNPDAAIIVPGMAYQPPLIGFKQLLNFGAYSIPDIGGWIFIGVGVILLFCVFLAWRKNRQKGNYPVLPVILFLFVSGISSCSPAPEAIKVGSDNCQFCKMTISDIRFGAEIVTKKGKLFKFDDSHCIIAFMKSGEIKSADIKDIYITNFSDGHQLINVDKSFLLKSSELRSPMGGNIAAFDNDDSLIKVRERMPGIKIGWPELIK